MSYAELSALLDEALAECRMTTPLAGLRVVELARILAGPWAGQTLADLGADVIKVESARGRRHPPLGPPFVDRDGDTSASYFHSCNRGKSSVTADFRTARRARGVLDLARDADVLIENFKLGGPGEIRARLRQPESGQPGADLLLDHRLRAGRALRAPRGL
jgi:crotonobetainyl-CoA:carnitine CoA-transferase CaiB-like acyl-CoA transferase